MGIDAATNRKVASFWLEYTSVLQFFGFLISLGVHFWDLPGRKGADSVKEKRRVICLITDLGVAAAPPKQPIFNIYSYNLIYISFGTSTLKTGLNYHVWGVFLESRVESDNAEIETIWSCWRAKLRCRTFGWTESRAQGGAIGDRKHTMPLGVLAAQTMVWNVMTWYEMVWKATCLVHIIGRKSTTTGL